MPSSCLSVCLSVTLPYCIKSAKRRITQITPHDSPMTLVFWHQSSRRNSNGIAPYGGDKCRWGGLKLASFDEKRALSADDRPVPCFPICREMLPWQLIYFGKMSWTPTDTTCILFTIVRKRVAMSLSKCAR